MKKHIFRHRKTLVHFGNVQYFSFVSIILEQELVVGFISDHFSRLFWHVDLCQKLCARESDRYPRCIKNI